MRLALGDRVPVLEGENHFIADGARIIGSVRLLTASSVWFNSVLRGDNDWITIGEHSNVQDCCVLHADPGSPVTVGAGVTIGHRATLHGCTIGDNSLIGIGATILNDAVIPGNCIVGAQALVTAGRTFPAGSLILGIPARVVRELKAAEIESIAVSAQSYVANAARYREELRRA